MYLESINSPADVKKLSVAQLNTLSSEIRQALLNRTSQKGGHVSPNLGIVEATIALHYVFNSPTDKFVFDVSHQTYTHKILTGRKYGFIEADKFDSISGYTNPAESEHDFFEIGHTSTSISLACGLAKSRDLKNEKCNIIALIGDGSLSGGEALEGLDFAGEQNSNFIIIVNDNDMSIAENHGGLYKNLKALRDSKGTCECNLFKAMGLDYLYVDEGNSIDALITAFSEVKDINHPIVVHINTIKGKGYMPAESNKEVWHWHIPFNIATGESPISNANEEDYGTSTREFLLKKIRNDERVVVISAAVPANINFNEAKRKEAGKQFVDVGIAEEHAMAFASGIAKNGGKPVFTTHSTFFQRTYDQLSQDVCINKTPVTLLVTTGSVYGMGDITHLGIFDIPLMSNIPNLVYLAPTNYEEYLAMLDWSIEQTQYPVAIRVPCNGIHHTQNAVPSDYSKLNTYEVVHQGNEIAVIGLGDFFQLGEAVVKECLQELHCNATLINPRYITGIDEQLLNTLKSTHKIVITLEDGILDGGFGEKIARFYGNSDMKVLTYGLKKEFLDRYSVDKVLTDNYLTDKQIVDDIKKLNIL